jgi:hypothetical protein
MLAVSPGVVSILLLYFLRGSTLFEVRPPAFENDEIAYWHMTLTFSQVGFQGGYYALNEVPSQAQFSHFGPHGPLFPIIYGSIGRLIGWYPYSATVINIAFVTLALGIFVWLTQPNLKQLIITSLLLFTFWPLWLFIPSNMQESLHQSIAIILAGLFLRLRLSPDISSKFRFIVFTLLLIASLLRFTWSILFIPFFLVRQERVTSWLNIIQALGQALVLMGLTFFTFQYLAAPFSRSFVSVFLKTSSISWLDGLRLLAAHAQSNSINLLSVLSGILLEVSQRYQALLIVVCVLGLYWFSYKTQKSATSAGTGAEPLFHLVNLGLPLILLVLFYEINPNWRDYRTLAPHLLLSLLLLTRSPQPWLVWGVIITNILLVQNFIMVYRENPYRYLIYDSQRVGIFQEQIKNSLVYKKDTNPWCNTLLVSIKNAKPELMAVPAGIGISTAFGWDQFQTPLKSKYILLNQEDEIYSHKFNLKRLTQTILGNLYLNPDSHCP